MKFTYETIGTNTFLVYEVAPTQELDTMSMGMLTNNRIPGYAQTIYTQMDNKRFIKFNVSSKVSAKQYFQGIVSKKQLLGVFMGITSALIESEEYMINPDAVIIDMDHIYADVSTYETVLLCLPVTGEEIEPVDLRAFFKEIMFTTQFDQNENCEHVAKIINFLNEERPFSVLEFRKVLDEAATASPRPVRPIEPIIAPVQTGILNEGMAETAVIPQTVSQGIPQAVPQAISQPIPQAVPQPMPQAIPQPMPQANSQPVPQAIPQPASQVIPQPAPQAAAPTFAGGATPSAINPGRPAPPPFVKPAGAAAPVKNATPTPAANNAAMPNYAVPGASVTPGYAVPGQAAKATSTPAAPAANGAQVPEKEISFWYLMQHYNKENAAAYKAQKAAKKQKKAAAAQVAPVPQAAPMQNNYTVPGAPGTPQYLGTTPAAQPAPQPIPKPMAQPVRQAIPQPGAQPMQPGIPQPVAQNYGMPNAQAGFGETTVLGGGYVGETTVLGAGVKPDAEKQAYLKRHKNNEKIILNKSVFRIGKERSYVDYFIGDNTAISRSHANIVAKDGEYYVIDTNSTNHTFVNGVMIQSNNETKLESGDVIKLANEIFDFIVE